MRSTTGSAPAPDGRRLLVGGLLLAATTFAVDLVIPLGVAAGIPHTLIVLIALRFRHRYAIPIAACLATLLTVLGGLLSPAGAEPLVVLTNRLLTLLAIWGVALFLHRFKKSQVVVAEQRRRLADMTYALDQAAIVAITDQRGTITYVNDKFCEISEYSRDELLGQDHRIVNSKFHSKEFIRDLWRTIAAGRVWRGEIRNRTKGGGFYWVDTTIVPFMDERGKPYQYLAIRSDITGRKRAEEQLRSREALAQIGQMAAVVAHEVKNPLAGIGGAVQIIGGNLPADSPDREVIATILERIGALDAKVQELLQFARPRPPRMVRVSLLPLLEEVAEHLRNDPHLEGVELRVLGEDVDLRGDGELLRDVFVNLVLNAAQSIDGGGRVDVETRIEGRRCRVVVRDNGPGIPEELRRRVFEPFFSTRHTGTGLGLSITKRIVEAHGGDLDIDCPQPGGTVVTVSLPHD